ncbi:MAG: putative phosphohydrolase [Chthonomonadales bacterium]|nr:putative phosphohydrolase [Chthonomonadales bacterium]
MILTENDAMGAMNRNVSNTLIPVDTGRKSPYMLEITTHDVPMHGLSEFWHGKTFVHLSDIHAGFGNTGAVYEEMIQRVNALEPDLILLTGDYLDDHPTDAQFPLKDILLRLRAKSGIFGSFGNHDHRRGIVGSRRLLQQSQIHALENENFELPHGLVLAGIDDLKEGKPDIPRALTGLPTDRTSIVLSHHPGLIEMVPERDVLILSGHTHGGQIALKFPSPRFVVKFHLHCNQVAGWYSNGKARQYVNRGLGVTGRPFRYRCPAEIGVFRMITS